MILKTSNECATNLSSSISRLGDFDTIHEQLRLVNKYHCDNDDSITRIDDSLTDLNELIDNHKEYFSCLTAMMRAGFLQCPHIQAVPGLEAFSEKGSGDVSTNMM